jgi:hypothetical protein
VRHSPLIASVRSFALNAMTVLLVIAAGIAATPRPLYTTVASAEAERPVAPVAPKVAADPGASATSPAATAATATDTSPAVAAVVVPESPDASAAIEPASAWAKTRRETAIWSGWDANAKEFAKVAADLTVQVIELRGPRAYVYFPGDSKGHKAGEVWIDRGDLAEAPWPRWARARRVTALRANPDPASEQVLPLARGDYVEAVGETRGRWARAFFLTDRQPGEWVIGWVDGLDLMMPRGEQTEMSSYLLTRAALLTSTPDLWLKVPYLTQLDGSAYAEANCGPTSVAMALAAIGKPDSLGTLREAALELQDMPDCDECGTYIQSLARVAELRGAKTFGLRDDPETLHRWTLDEIRQQLRADHVVIPQVKFRFLPGRARSAYGGDHYIVVVGMAGNNFIYNDPIDSDGRGYGRVISAEALERAMVNATDEYARAAFAVGR